MNAMYMANEKLDRQIENKNFVKSSKGFHSGSVVKKPLAIAKDEGSIPGHGRSPVGNNGNPLQYSCLENPKDKGAWQATVHVVARRQTLLSN